MQYFSTISQLFDGDDGKVGRVLCAFRTELGEDIRLLDDAMLRADWKLNAQGTAMEVFVKPFGGVDPTDETAAKCLRNALQKMQMSCPRDGKPVAVRTAICL